jgi:hypothetical protein
MSVNTDRPLSSDPKAEQVLKGTRPAELNAQGQAA